MFKKKENKAAETAHEENAQAYNQGDLRKAFEGLQEVTAYRVSQHNILVEDKKTALETLFRHALDTIGAQKGYAGALTGYYMAQSPELYLPLLQEYTDLLEELKTPKESTTSTGDAST